MALEPGMLTREQYEKCKHRIIEIVTKYLPQASIYLYGSRARNDYRQGSDIDVLLDAQSKIDRVVLAKIKDDIEESTIPLLVDVVDKYEVSDEFKNSIQKDLIVWKS